MRLPYLVGIEIEHKFLVTGDAWRAAPGIRYRQGYLSISTDNVVRVRVGGGTAFLTIKSATVGIRRSEYEYPIPVPDAEEMMEKLCDGRVVDKTRYRVPFGKLLWEVDEFHGSNEGLVLAEIELQYEQQPFVKPDWVGADVSHDPRYTSAMLAVHPFARWPRSAQPHDPAHDTPTD